MRKLAGWVGALLAASTVLLLLSASGIVGHAAASGRFTLAVLRRDGILIPFATYSGRYWFNYWPTPGLEAEVPLSVDLVTKGDWPDKKPVLTWTAWPTTGESRAVTVQKPAWIPAHCMMNFGLQTDYKSQGPAPPIEVQPYPKDGLATDGDIRIERVEVLDEKARDWKAVIGQVTREVNEEENKRVREYSTWWAHPSSTAERAATPLRLDVLCRTPGAEAGASAYYFEGSKRYPNPKMKVGGKSCDIITFVSGWFLTAAKGEGGTRIVHATLTDCRMEGMVYALPLGAFRIKNSLLWAVQMSGWGFERYDVVGVGRSKIKSQRETPGGWCK